MESEGEVLTLDELKKLSAEATKAPWEWQFDTIVGYEPFTDGSKGKGFATEVICTDSRFYPPRDNDADLILAMRNNIDKLIAVAEAAKELMFGEVDLDDGYRVRDNLMKALAALEDEK